VIRRRELDGRGAGRRSGALAGVVAAAAWAAAEPALGWALQTPYSDVRLLGRLLTRGGKWPVAGLALHLGNGALFGALFARAGLRGIRAGVLAAEVENVALWPALALVDRLHPDRRSGAWPPLVANARVAVYEVIAHALFGAVLGALVRPR
jgi:hypothetical protein